MRGRLVDDDAHGAVGRVGAHVDHGAGEPLIPHGRHGDQHLPVEKPGLDALAQCPRLADRRTARIGPRPRSAAALAAVPAAILAAVLLTAREALATDFHTEMLPD